MHRLRCTVTLLLAVMTSVQALAWQARSEPRKVTAPNQNAEDAVQIRRALEDWVAATNAGQRLRAAEIWAEDLVGWYPGRPDDTYPREIENARRTDGVKPAAHADLKIDEILVSGNLAVVRDTWSFTRKTPDGEATTKVRSFEIWRKTSNSSWKIARWISSPEPDTK